MGASVSLSHLSLFTSFLPSKRTRGACEIFQVGETRIFISAKKQCSEYFPFINALKTLEEKEEKNTHPLPYKSRRLCLNIYLGLVFM